MDAPVVEDDLDHHSILASLSEELTCGGCLHNQALQVIPGCGHSVCDSCLSDKCPFCGRNVDISLACKSQTMDRLSRIVARHKEEDDNRETATSEALKMEIGESTASTMKHSAPAIDDL